MKITYNAVPKRFGIFSKYEISQKNKKWLYFELSQSVIVIITYEFSTTSRRILVFFDTWNAHIEAVLERIMFDVYKNEIMANVPNN